MSKTKNLTLSGLFLALGIILPFFTGQIPEIGGMLLPMHIPVLLCGFVCGPQSGLIVGFITPLLRSLIFGMPPLLPKALTMAFELAVYGWMSGSLYRKLPKNAVAIYLSLIISMVAGRVVWGLVSVPIYGMSGTVFSLQLFWAGAFLEAIPGIILQLILIPLIIMGLKKARVVF